MPVRYNLSSVWVRLSIFSQLSIIQYVGLCVFSLPISFVMIEKIYILLIIIIIKSEVWTITHCLGLSHETMVCSACLSIFYSLRHIYNIWWIHILMYCITQWKTLLTQICQYGGKNHLQTRPTADCVGICSQVRRYFSLFVWHISQVRRFDQPQWGLRQRNGLFTTTCIVKRGSQSQKLTWKWLQVVGVYQGNNIVKFGWEEISENRYVTFCRAQLFPSVYLNKSTIWHQYWLHLQVIWHTIFRLLVITALTTWSLTVCSCCRYCPTKHDWLAVMMPLQISVYL